MGQLNNVVHIQDPSTAKHTLLQVILALKDATLLPWEAVKSAWGNSMHEVEQGTLTWEDSVQWSLNRLSASQIAMANMHTVNQPSSQRRDKICKYYNQGSVLTTQTMGTSDITVIFVPNWGGFWLIPKSNVMPK